ncbi:MAG: protoporphyrinogen oxidase HemJ [Tatlockia sp.]|nr:protoporphyrinogen oxidase HemJ [Tatlockia sp.]
MLWIKAFHIIAMVAWFAGLFYLPRLFVYHAESKDSISLSRFKTMERRLYYGITWPAALLTTVLGLLLLSYNSQYYLKTGWMHAKLGFVVLLWIYHLACGYFFKQFAIDKNSKSSFFYRIFNEIPTLLLIGIVLLVVLKPF